MPIMIPLIAHSLYVIRLYKEWYRYQEKEKKKKESPPSFFELTFKQYVYIHYNTKYYNDERVKQMWSVSLQDAT